MADEVVTRIAAETPFQENDVAEYELSIDQNSILLAQNSSQSHQTAASGETVIRLDWGPVSTDLGLSTLATAERLAEFIFAGETWIVEGTLHLIGHSRGTSLVTALAAELGARGVWVDQTTFLDAVPVGGDYPMEIPENAVFADGYWRTGGLFSPDGQAVSGAYNIQLNESHFSGGSIGYGGLSDVHSDVHLWYHGTVDHVGGFSDVVNGSGETVADADAAYWFLPQAYTSVDGPIPTGREDTGYAFSRVVGFDRPSAGVTQAVGGSGQRDALDWSGAVWPNVLELTVSSADLHFDVGESIPVAYYFQDADGNADVAFFLDIDRNPNNGNEIPLGPSFVQMGGTSALALDNKNLPTDGVGAGGYYLAAQAADSGGRARWAYAPQVVTLIAVPPEVVGTEVNSGDANRSGIRELTFHFSEDVTVAGATSLNLFNHTTSQSIDLTTAVLTNNGTASVGWNLSGLMLPDGRYTAELPAQTAVNGSGVPLASSHAFEFHVALGDVNGDGLVNASDFVAVDAAFDPLPGAAFRPGDGNGDGLVNASDFVLVDANFNPLPIPSLAYDFGDAPEGGSSFPTTLAGNGARHSITGNGLFLGSSRDAEVDGQPTADASGDGPDEDGVMVDPLVQGTSVSVMVTSSGAGFVSGWIDYNQDGDWDDPGEQVLSDAAVVSGANNLQIAVPAGAMLGDTVGRFRLTSTAGYSYGGFAPDGEVEDYSLTVTSPPVSTANEAMPVVVLGWPLPWWMTQQFTHNFLVLSARPLSVFGRLPFPFAAERSSRLDRR